LDFQHLCHRLLESHDQIIAVWIRSGDKDVVNATKQGFPLPNTGEMQKILLQGWVMLSLAGTNKAMYGQVESIVVNHKELSAFLVPIDQKHFIGIGCAKPTNRCEILDAIQGIIA
jgi:hypothetical protein